jgi:hypothetical protein
MQKIYDITILEKLVQTCKEIRPDEFVKVGPAIDAWDLGQHSLNSSIDRANPQDMPATVRATLDTNPVSIHLCPRLSISDGV